MLGKLNIWFSVFDKLYDNEDINKLGKYKTAYQHRMTESMRCFISIAHQIFFRMRLRRSKKTRTDWN